MAQLLDRFMNSQCMFEQLVIRHAQHNDADAIAHLAKRTFHDTFAADNASSDMEIYLRDTFSLERTQAELVDSNNIFLLAFAHDAAEPIGYAKLKIEKEDMSVQGTRTIEIERLYVDAIAIGQGVGASLMQACLNEATALDYQAVKLGVWERNERAIAFYKRWGFETVGTRVFMLGSDRQNDFILQRAVSI